MGQIGWSVPTSKGNYAASPTVAPAINNAVASTYNPAAVSGTAKSVMSQPAATTTATTAPTTSNVIQGNSSYPTAPGGAFIPATVASFSPIQEQAMQMALDQPGNANSGWANDLLKSIMPQVQGLYGQAADYAKQGAGVTFNPNDAMPFMNKYIDQYINPGVAQINRQHDIQQSKINDESSRVGAFGDTRDAVQRGLNDESTGRNVADFTGQAYYNSWQSALNNALQAAQMRSSNLFGGASSLMNNGNGLASNAISTANAGAGLGQNDLNNYRTKMGDIMGAGTTVQNQNQKLLDAIEGNRQSSNQYDWNQINNLLQSINSFKAGTTSTISPSNGSNVMQGLLGAGGALKSLLGGGTSGMSPAPAGGTLVPDFSWNM